WFLFWLIGTIHNTILEPLRTQEKAAAKLIGAKDEAKDGEPRKDSPISQVPGWVYVLSDAVYAVIPHTKDLTSLTTQVIARGVLTENEIHDRGLDKVEKPSWAATFGVSGGFIVVLLGLSCWWFARRDY